MPRCYSHGLSPFPDSLRTACAGAHWFAAPVERDTGQDERDPGQDQERDALSQDQDAQRDRDHRQQVGDRRGWTVMLPS